MIPNLSKLHLLDGLPTDAPATTNSSEPPSETVFRELLLLIADTMSPEDIANSASVNKEFESALCLFLPPFNLKLDDIVSRKQLNLCDNKIDKRNMQKFLAAVQIGALPLLEFLNLSLNNNGVEWMDVFSKALCDGALSRLRILHITDNNTVFEGVGMEYFVNALKKGTLQHLMKLSLSDNYLGEQGMAIFSDALLIEGVLRKLDDLSLDNNNLGIEAMEAFAATLEKGALPSLTILDLSRNEFGDNGMEALAEALKKGALPSLTSLNLKNNDITEKGMLAFDALLEDTLAVPKLKLVELDENERTREGSVKKVERNGCTCSLSY